MTASQSGGRQSCPECGTEFDRIGAVEEHFFEQHLVAGADTGEENHDTGPEAEPGATDTAGPSSETDDTARDSRETTDDAGPSSESGTATVSRSGGSRGPSVDGGTIRSRGVRRSDLFVALFALVCVGGPVVALALAVT